MNRQRVASPWHPRQITMNESNRRVFVSSTVYDFRDLRSALKTWLEEYGFEVRMSEMNDFPQSPDCNSFPSCLRAIDDCGYFVLLIGGRVGGWYDEPKRISITQWEYRHAYERLKEGKLDLLLFVRKEIWDIREDRKALRKHLEHEAELELSPQQMDKVVNHPSKFLNDAEFITAFIEEVARVREMKEAAKGSGNYPVGNWVYQFSSFKDIVDACKTVLNLSGNLRHKALVANLKYELEQNLGELLERQGDKIEKVTRRGQFARASLRGGVSDSSQYEGDHLVWLFRFLIRVSCKVGKRLNRTALTEAITSGEFLDYDRVAGRHTVGPVQKALLDLDGQIERLWSLASHISLADEWIVKNRQRFLDRRKDQFTIENEQMLRLFAVYDSIENIIIFSTAIYKALDGNNEAIATITIHGSSPVEEQNELMDAIQPSHDEVARWLNG